MTVDAKTVTADCRDMSAAAKPKIYLPLGRWRMRVPRRKPVRIALAVVMLVRGLVPTPTSPILLSGAVTLLSMDMPRLRRWRRQVTVRLGRRRMKRAAR